MTRVGDPKWKAREYIIVHMHTIESSRDTARNGTVTPVIKGPAKNVAPQDNESKQREGERAESSETFILR